MVNSKKPFVTVIVPIYNAEQTLAACCESILAQEYESLELILVDDGSTDRSAVICQEFVRRDSRVRYIYQNNCGVSAARNRGIDCSSGEYLAFVDADDVVDVQYLQNLMRFREAFGGGECIVVSGFRRVDMDRPERCMKVSFGYSVFTTDEFSRAIEELQLYRFGYPFSKLFPAAVIQRDLIRFDERIRFGEDLLFFLEVLCKSKCLVVADGAFYEYRWQPWAGLSCRYDCFENEFLLFRRFSLLMTKLCGEELKRGASERKWFFLRRAIYALYRPETREPREKRLGIIRKFPVDWPKAFVYARGAESLLKGGFFRTYDAVMAVLFSMRYGPGKYIWQIGLWLVRRMR